VTGGAAEALTNGLASHRCAGSDGNEPKGGNDGSGGGVALTNVISFRARDAVYVTFDARNGSDQQLRFGISSIPPGFTLISQSGEQYQSDFENSRRVEVLQSGAASSYAIAFHAPDHGKAAPHRAAI
jgi:hypothetical protein